MAVNCSLPTLLSNARCYLDQCSSEAEREGIQIYLGVLALAGLGGASYTPESLQTAAKTWQTLSEKQLAAIQTYIAAANATIDGATVPGTINAIKAGAKCYMCIPELNRKQLLVFLNCAISNLVTPA